jgi:hypothetical protein
MENIFNDGLTLDARIDFDRIPIVETFVIDNSLAFNAAKVCLRAYDTASPQHLDILMLANGIRHPFRDLVPGLVISVPDAAFVTSQSTKNIERATSIRLKNKLSELGNIVTF